ncbi:hypothetical protein [Streptomyces sp. NPDC001380]|uniref:hypothetical protein n=1 Tax=Streptomyces sp. NPDC001380 TaxID=3364566 RepID=UPI00367B955A
MGAERALDETVEVVGQAGRSLCTMSVPPPSPAPFPVGPSVPGRRGGLPAGGVTAGAAPGLNR